MTIAEIERTLRSLCVRHHNLDAELLTTLLTAGGWEEKVIKEALSLFTSSPEKYRPPAPLSTPHKVDAIPTTITQAVQASGDSVLAENNKEEGSAPKEIPQEKPSEGADEMVYYTGTGEEEKPIEIIPDSKDVRQTENNTDLQKNSGDGKEENKNSESYDPSHVAQLVSPNEKAISLPESESHKTKNNEPESLIKNDDNVRTYVQSELPDNLPLRPFDSAPHVWPFSKYKEVFHTDTGKSLTAPAADTKEDVVTLLNISSEVSTPSLPEAEPSYTKIKIKRTGFDGEDEGLIFLTATALLIILLLLAYMYSNGRI